MTDRSRRLDRRAFLRETAGLGAAALALGACGDDGTGADADTGPDPDEGAIAWAAADVPEDAELFPLGVQSGAVRGDTALVWGYAAGAASARLRVWREAATEGEVVLAHDATHDTADGYLKVALEGLEPDTWYHYAWLDEDLAVRSRLGTFRSALAEGQLATLTVGATACTKWTKAPYTSLVVAGEHDYDLFCQLGDMSYNDEAVTLDEYREAWHFTLKDPGYAAILPKAAYYATLDDHEIANNFDPTTMDPVQKQAALDAWFETLPVPRHEGDRIWDSYRWGATLEIFVLDCRTERQPETRGTDGPIYISKEQMAWLKEGLSTSPCHFKVILNSVPIIGFPEQWGIESDRWQGYPEQREELLDHIVDDDIHGVWFLAGDLHAGVVARVEREGPRSALWEILVGPGAPSLLNPIPGLVELDPSLEQVVMPPDWFLYASSEYAATLLTFDPHADTVHVKFVATDGETVLYEGTLTQTENE